MWLSTHLEPMLLCPPQRPLRQWQHRHQQRRVLRAAADSLASPAWHQAPMRSLHPPPQLLLQKKLPPGVQEYRRRRCSVTQLLKAQASDILVNDSLSQLSTVNYQPSNDDFLIMSALMSADAVCPLSSEIHDEEHHLPAAGARGWF